MLLGSGSVEEASWAIAPIEERTANARPAEATPVFDLRCVEKKTIAFVSVQSGE